MTTVQREIRFIDYAWAMLFQDQPIFQKWTRQMAKLVVNDRVSISDVIAQLALSGRKSFDDEDARAEYVLGRVTDVASKLQRKKNKSGA